MTNFFGPHFWHEIHGGSTHFPIALLVAAILFDVVGYFLPPRYLERSRELHAAAFYALLLGALVSFAAVLSGIFVSDWEVWGGGALGLHHRFVWPAFALIFGLAVWRALVRNRASRRAMAAYLVVEFVAAALMLFTGYQGGRMLGA